MSQYKILKNLVHQLIGFNTISRSSNLRLIQFIQDYLGKYGISAILAYSDDKERANLYATIGPKNKRGILLSGHTDVVPANEPQWQSDPFQAIEKNDKIYGRGTADMKSFIAAVLAWVPIFLEKEPSIPIHLAFSYDEEIGCIGVHKLLTMMKDMPILPAMCIVGEPTSMQVVNGHKGKIGQEVTIKGLAAHSGLLNKGVNAIEYAAQLIVFIKHLNQELRDIGPHEDAFEINHTSLQTGIISGGTALNIVPESCTFKFEIRNIPSQNISGIIQRIHNFALGELLPKMKAHSVEANAQCAIEFDTISEYPGLFTPANETVVHFVQSLTEVEGLGKINFGTEGGLFSKEMNIPTVVCGPGNMEQGHKPNEYIENSQLQAIDQFMNRLNKAIHQPIDKIRFSDQ